MIGSTPAKPLALSDAIRLKIRVEELASSLIAKNDSRIIIKDRQMLIEAIVRIDRTGLRRALRKDIGEVFHEAAEIGLSGTVSSTSRPLSR